MKNLFLTVILINCICIKAFSKDVSDSVRNPVLEPFTYSENFEDRELGAWASYPHWQDIAYDENFRIDQIVPGDKNVSLVQKVTPYSNVDNYAGAQKLLNMFLVPGSTVKLRYYLKANIPAEYIKIRFAAGSIGKLDYTVAKPFINKWVWVTVSYADFVASNPALKGKSNVRIHAFALLAKFPDADPAMPIYLGVDDIIFKGSRAVPFYFSEPQMHKLPEYDQYIPARHYEKGDIFKLSGKWPVRAKKVTLEFFSFVDTSIRVYNAEMTPTGQTWNLSPVTINFEEGLYLGRLSAFDGSYRMNSTEFTFHVAPKNIAGKHPRLRFHSDQTAFMQNRFEEDRFQTLHADIAKNAKLQRTRIPLESIVYDLDQFPDENWLPSWSAMGAHIYHTGEALHANAMAYHFHGDAEAGKYAKDLLLKYAEWPSWTHPWLIKRGKYSEHRGGGWSHRIAETYDLTYNLMNETERLKIRKAIMKHVIEAVHRTFVANDDITAKTSNWIAMTVGGSLMNMAAIFKDGVDSENLEPYFSGAMIKFYTFLNKVADSKDGGWGEGLGYNGYSFLNMSLSVPALDNVFKIDVTKPLEGSYNEFIWAGNIKDKKWFQFGDSEGDLFPVSNWGFLLNKKKDPRLAWHYNYLKKGETISDVQYDFAKLPLDSPFKENPVKAFHKIGSTVFKSGWGKSDLTFVMRTGPFYNHQHLDQGNFWFADKGVIFIEERPLHNSNYYDDPLYQSHFIQPVSHSTILINNNPQSQRAGDHIDFAPGFNDHAFIAQFLDGKDAAFSRGDIGRLYWNKVKSLSRNVLFIKPGIVLMLDEIVPSNENVDVTLLYQTEYLEDLTAGSKTSMITKEGQSLLIMHLFPEAVKASAVETPHYLKTLQTVKPLRREGMLTVSSRTTGKPLTMANLLTTTAAGKIPDLVTSKGAGFISGSASGKRFAFTTNPGSIYNIEGTSTDALALVWADNRYFVSMSKSFTGPYDMKLLSERPITFEYTQNEIKYSDDKGGSVRIGRASKPSSITLNGNVIKNFTFDPQRKLITIDIPKGEGIIIIN